MINFFGTNRVVPNGYIYTSHKGSEYIYFEGIWFNHKNMKMIDPNKTPKLNEAAKKQIIEHNCNNKVMIGESFNFTGKTYTYVGKERYTEDGHLLSESSIISEVIADDQRVYNVSRDTLDKEWNELKFFILPPHTEDVTIPAGLIVKGYRFIPKQSRFVSTKDGSYADKMLTKKLWSVGMGLAKSLRVKPGNDILPINSTIMLHDKNQRAVWNGLDFCDNDGNVVLDPNKSEEVKQRYIQFVHSNPSEFSEITGHNGKERNSMTQNNDKMPQPQLMSRSAQQSTPVTEAIGKIEPSNPDSTEIPDGFELDGGEYIWDDVNGRWATARNEVIVDSDLISSLNADAVKRIEKLNSTDKFPVGSIAEYNGQFYTWTGERFYNRKEGTIPEKETVELIDDFSNNPDHSNNQTRSDDKTSTDNIASDEQNQEKQSSPEQRDNFKDSEIVNTDQESETNTNSEVSDHIPEGFVITSKAGVNYTRKGGKWISSQTKKPMNSSAALSIDRAAKNKINKYNETADIKIGDIWKSNKGNTYTFVGDDRFISSNGKLAPKSAVPGIMDKMRSEKSSDSTDSTDSTDDTQNSEPQNSNDIPKQDNSASTDEPKNTTSTGEANVNSDLESLAQQIKAHPKARKITVLMTRGDKVSLLAADLILSGKEQDAIKILKALNSSDE